MSVVTYNDYVKKEDYVGCVLGITEHNYYDDSDFCAIVWDDKKQAIEEVCYASSRYWSYSNDAFVDATPEVKALAAEYLKKKYIDVYLKAAEELSKKVEKNRLVKVVRGRKVPVGTVGEVFWIGEKSYGRKTVTYAGIRTARGEICWTSIENLETIPVEFDRDKIINVAMGAAQRAIERGNWSTDISISDFTFLRQIMHGESYA